MVRVHLVVPSSLELPVGLFEVGRDYHDGWAFDSPDEALRWAEHQLATYPGVVVAFEVTCIADDADIPDS
jgi:hypothetical protein